MKWMSPLLFLAASDVKILFLFHFSMKFMKANIKASNRTSRFAASHLGLFCLPMFHKKDARLILVNIWLRMGVTECIFFFYLILFVCVEV